MSDTWYFRRGQKEFGPVTFTLLAELARYGQLQPSDLVRREGAADWIEAKMVQGVSFPGTGEHGRARSPAVLVRTPQSPEQTWHLRRDKQQHGPLSWASLKQMAADGQLRP